jgi:hypothetical protein
MPHFGERDDDPPEGGNPVLAGRVFHPQQHKPAIPDALSGRVFNPQQFQPQVQDVRSARVFNPQQQVKPNAFDLQSVLAGRIFGQRGSAGGGGGLVVTETDGSPSGQVTKLIFPTGSVSIVGGEATISVAGGSGGGLKGAAWDGAGFQITAGTSLADVAVYCPSAGTITKVTVLTRGGTGSCVIDIWKDTYANFPPTVLDTITASAKPTISSATKYQDSTLTGWNTTISGGDVLMFHVDSTSVFTFLEIVLEIS